MDWLLEGPATEPIYEVGMYLLESGNDFPFDTIDMAMLLSNIRVRGVPNCEFSRHPGGGNLWLRQWVNGLSELRDWNGMDCVQNEGTGLAIIGCREWQNYRASAKLTLEAAKSSGLAVHVQGMRRYYALVFEQGSIALIKQRDGRHELARIPFEWEFDQSFHLEIVARTVDGKTHLTGLIDGRSLLEATDEDRPLIEGAIGIVLTEGRTRVGAVSIRPI